MHYYSKLLFEATDAWVAASKIVMVASATPASAESETTAAMAEMLALEAQSGRSLCPDSHGALLGRMRLIVLGTFDAPQNVRHAERSRSNSNGGGRGSAA
eukprot:CAMPEP_0172801012 /NCGR_PEP_ID=MMETSP1075-20121228/2923_1 /TAXON_ID=2916 /ORGANISM="Ceratium fusus, Strain PA161109" /LENGTH=99 /DNA_ID=CAMNT_0013638991 /DNA_START=204 /DNA_END=500 /DNA_ORIENTATION=-